MKLVIDNYFTNAKKIIKKYIDVHIWLWDNFNKSRK